MPKGGARVNSGPPPDPNALRRDRPSDKNGWITLPAGGYDGPIPDWPLLEDVALLARRDVALDVAQRITDELADADPGRARAALQKKLETANQTIALLDKRIDAQREQESSVWGQAWRTPQAAAWAANNWTRDVAQYVRHKVLGELGSLDDAKEARQWSDRLGLNPAAMLRNRWKISADEVAAKRATPPPAAGRQSARDRFKVVRDGGA